MKTSPVARGRGSIPRGPRNSNRWEENHSCSINKSWLNTGLSQEPLQVLRAPPGGPSRGICWGLGGELLTGWFLSQRSLLLPSVVVPARPALSLVSPVPQLPLPPFPENILEPEALRLHPHPAGRGGTLELPRPAGHLHEGRRFSSLALSVSSSFWLTPCPASPPCSALRCVGFCDLQHC